MYVPRACALIVATAFRHGILHLSFAPYCEDTSQSLLPSPLAAFGTRLLKLLELWPCDRDLSLQLYECDCGTCGFPGGSWLVVRPVKVLTKFQVFGDRPEGL